MFCSLHMTIFYLQINKNSKQEEKIARMFLAIAKLRAEHAKSQIKAIKILLHKQLQKRSLPSSNGIKTSTYRNHHKHTSYIPSVYFSLACIGVRSLGSFSYNGGNVRLRHCPIPKLSSNGFGFFVVVCVTDNSWLETNHAQVKGICFIVILFVRASTREKS